MKKFIDTLIKDYELTENFKHEQAQTMILGTGQLSNGMIARITVRITPGNTGDAKFKVMPKSFKYTGGYPELNPPDAPIRDKRKRKTI